METVNNHHRDKEGAKEKGKVGIIKKVKNEGQEP